ncbi:MAG: GNAT family N-acetyltransferase [Erysipelotrichaceae bacterium]
MIRQAEYKDIEPILVIINKAIEDLKQRNIDQWQNGYPNQERIEEDIYTNKAYVLQENQLLGYMYVDEYEATYDQIDGHWLNAQPYYVIHRFVVDMDERGKGLAYQLLDYVEEMAKKNQRDIRVDTHFDNLAMQAFLNKHGFKDCGIITLTDGSLRKAYQKWIK